MCEGGLAVERGDRGRSNSFFTSDGGCLRITRTPRISVKGKAEGRRTA